jgi:hypothetical protein
MEGGHAIVIAIVINNKRCGVLFRTHLISICQAIGAHSILTQSQLHSFTTTSLPSRQDTHLAKQQYVCTLTGYNAVLTPRTAPIGIMAGPTGSQPHGSHPIHIHPVRPLYRFAAVGLGASMWFFVCNIHYKDHIPGS